MKIRFNQANIDMLEEEANIALWETAEAIKTDLVQSQTVPKDHGNLEGDMFVDPPNPSKNIKGVVKIVNPAVYSRKVYFDPEIHIKQEKNKNAKQHWFDDYIDGDKKDLPLKYYAKLLKRRMNS